MWWLLSWSTGSRAPGFSGCSTWAHSCSSRAVEHKLSNCGTRAWLLCILWDLPRSGIKPMSPALAGGFFTTEPLGKTPSFFLYLIILTYYFQIYIISHFGHALLFATLWTVARQAPLSMEFSRQEYWNELPCSPPDLPDPGIKPISYMSCFGSLVLYH